jgi:hypothetical protein
VGSGDDRDEFFRFLVTRLWSFVSLGGGRAGDGWIRGTIVDTQEVIKNEIWCLTVQDGSSRKSYHVLQHTCEVVGHPPGLSILNPSEDNQATLDRNISLRSDWSQYIARRMDPTALAKLPSLMEHLTWPNHEDFYRGISKHFLKKINQDDPVLANLKRIVAERYVLACVVGNRYEFIHGFNLEVAYTV